MPIFNVLLPGQTPTHWDRTVCTFKAPTAPTTDLVRYFLETLYPNLSDVPYALSAFDDDGHLKSTPLQSFENVSIFTSLHSVEDVQKPPELGNPVLPDRRMNKNVSGKNTGSRLGSRSGSRTARKRSATSSPGETHTEDLDSLALSSRLEQLRDEEEPLSVNAMQSKLRTACMVRDRACVISRKVDLDACDAAHILTPEYSYQFVSTNGHDSRYPALALNHVRSSIMPESLNNVWPVCPMLDGWGGRMTYEMR